MASVSQHVWQQTDCFGSLRESAMPLHHAQRAALLTRVSSCSSTASCATAQWGEVLEQQQHGSSTAARTRNIATAVGARKRSTPEPACNVPAKRVKEQGGIGCSSDLEALDASALQLRDAPSASAGFEGSGAVLGDAQAAEGAGCAPAVPLPAPSGSGELSFCHFDLPGLLDDLLGGASCLGLVAPTDMPAVGSLQPEQQVSAALQQPSEVVAAAGSVDPVLRNISGLRDVLRNLRKTERGMPPVIDYVSQLACLPPGEYVDRHMRRIAVSWLVEVAGEFQLHTETVYLAVALLDRYLSTQAIKRSFLQLVSTTCMFLAAKHEEEVVPSVNDFTNIADNCFTKADLLRMESVVLDTLEFRLNVPTPHDFLQLYMQGAAVGPRTRALATYVLELTLLDYAFVGQRGSVVAAAALHYAALHQGEVAAAHALADLSEVPAALLQPALADLATLHAHASTIPLHDDVDPVGPIKDRHTAVASLAAMPIAEAVSTCAQVWGTCRALP